MIKLINNFRIQHLIKKGKFEEATSLLDKFESNNSLPIETIKLYRNLCIEGKITQLHSRASDLFGKAKYKECAQILSEVKETMVANSKKFGLEENLLNNFFESIKREIENNYTSANVPLKEINPLRKKFQEKAKEIFPGNLGKEYSEILVDALLITSICKSFEK